MTYASVFSCACDIEHEDFINLCNLHEAAPDLLEALEANRPYDCWCPPQKNGKSRNRHQPKCRMALKAIARAKRKDEVSV